MDDRNSINFLMGGTLNKHSALVNCKILEGKTISKNAYKIIWKIFYNEQTILKSEFVKAFKQLVKYIFYFDSEYELENIFFNIYSKNKVNYSHLKINKKNLFNIINNFTKYKFSEILKLYNDDYKLSLLLDFQNLYLTNIVFNKDKDFQKKVLNEINFFNDKFKMSNKKNKRNLMVPENYDFSSTQLSLIINELKDYYGEKIILSKQKENFLNLTEMNHFFKSNIIRLKNEIENACKTIFEINYLDYKDLNINFQSNLISLIEFEKAKNEKQTLLKYSIPKDICNLLLNPKSYVPIEGEYINNLNYSNSIILYELLKDHFSKEAIVLTRENFFNIINCSDKCKNNRYELEKRILIPILKDINETTDIYIKYEFSFKSSHWRSIIFHIKKNKITSFENLKFIIEQPWDNITDIPNKKIDYKKNKEVFTEVNKVKENIYVKRAWKTDGDRKINQMLKTYGPSYTITILKELNKSLNKNIETTITAYINGIIKNKKEEKKKESIEPIKLEKETLILNEKDRKNLDEIIAEIKNDIEKKKVKPIKRTVKKSFIDQLIVRYKELNEKPPLSFIFSQKFKITE